MHGTQAHGELLKRTNTTVLRFAQPSLQVGHETSADTPVRVHSTRNSSRMVTSVAETGDGHRSGQLRLHGLGRVVNVKASRAPISDL